MPPKMLQTIFSNCVRPNQIIPVFRVTQPYLNLLVKFRFSGKKIILCTLRGEMPFKMHKIVFFSRKKNAYPTLNFQTRYPKHTSFLLALPS